MKKKDITFADKANKIINKYKLRLGKNLEKHDPLAMKGLERELDALKAEQDAYKQQQQANAQQQQIANQFVPEQQIQMSREGNLPQYGFGNTDNKYMTKQIGFDTNRVDYSKYNNKYNLNTDNYSFPNNVDQNRFNLGVNLNTDNNIDNWNLMSDYEKNNFFNTDLQGKQRNNNNLENPNIQNNKDYTPYNPVLGGASPIPLAANLAGSIIGYKSAKPSYVTYDRVTPEEIDLSSERENAIRQADIGRLMALRNARGLGLNAGATATLGAASQEAIDTSLGNTLGKSYLNEALTNSQNRQRANQTNASISMREKDSRLREDDAVTNIRQQAIQNALQNVDRYFSDVQKGRMFNEDINNRDTIYKPYEDPNQTGLGKLFFPRYKIYSDPNRINNYKIK